MTFILTAAGLVGPVGAVETVIASLVHVHAETITAHELTGFAGIYVNRKQILNLKNVRRRSDANKFLKK